MAADTSGLDVDDPARAGRDRVARNADRVDRLVEADGRADPPLQLDVVAHVVVIERLLDHHQVVTIELGQMIGIGQRVRGVGVDHQRDVAELAAHHFDGHEIPAGLDLDLDALIARGQLTATFSRSSSSES